MSALFRPAIIRLWENRAENKLSMHEIATEEAYGEDHFVFQQDSAPAHKDWHTQDWLEENVPDFITKDQWPPNNPESLPQPFTEVLSINREKIFKNV